MGDTTQHDTLTAFCEVFTKLAGQVHRAPDPTAIAPILDSILHDHAPTTLATAGLPTRLLDAVQAACDAHGVTLITSPFAGMSLPDAVDRAGIGITMAAFAVAETGSIVELTTHDAGRLVSSLPRVHVCILRRDTIVPTLPEAAPLMRQAFQSAGPMTVTFISGPSRTGDIEMKLTLGVHGPEIMHVIILDRA